MGSERKGFTVKWRIENFSLKNNFFEDSLNSPGFLLNKVGDTRWKLNFSIVLGHEKPCGALSLVRETLNDGPSNMLLNVELSHLASDESPLKLQEFKNISFSNQTTSQLLMLEEDILHIDDDSSFQDLTFRCSMWPSQGQFSEDAECTALTRICEELKCFNVVLEQFSALQRGQERPAFVRSQLEETPHLLMNIRLTTEGEIEIVGIKPHSGFKVTCNCKFFLLDAAGNREECMEEDIWFRNFHVNIFCLKLPKTRLMDNRERYLPNDVLTLCFETVSLTGIEITEIDKPEYRCESPETIRQNSSDQKKLNISCNPQEPSTSLKDDLMSLYQDRIFSDTKLRSGTETFPAHRNVLSVRSPVFKAMFTHDMKEKANDCVDIPDLSSDTIRRMLLFLYTDTTEDLDWDDAKDLYFAADKYQILSLKKRCSSFLEENIHTANVCEILALADMHEDSALKSAMQNFILINDKEVFGSKEWKMFINSNAKLAAETMCLKYT